MDRVATFQHFIARRPDDPFPRYGLAMELRTRGDAEAAVREFEILMEKFPDYVPTYLMAGTTLSQLGRADEAREVYRRGIEVARGAGDHHAAGELEAAVAALG
jgi:tetratricopeptide (TPR) repeat protein